MAPPAIIYVTRKDLQTSPGDARCAIAYMRQYDSEASMYCAYAAETSKEAVNARRYILHLKEIATANRINSVSQVYAAKSGHPGGSLSGAEILTVLYHAVMRHDPKNPGLEQRDRFVLSKGHAVPGLYSELAMDGYFDDVRFDYRGETLSGVDLLRTFRMTDGYLPGHAKEGVAGVEACTGSLGTGISIANGLALALRDDAPDADIFVLCGDGELQEGQIWESAMFAGHYRFGNIIAIVDHNGLQNDERTDETMNVRPIGDKFRAFGWEVVGRDMGWGERAHLPRDGHDIVYLSHALSDAKLIGRERKRPVVVIANTDKGRGVSFMDNKGEWHGKAPDDEQYGTAMYELSSQLEALRSAYHELH